MGYRSDVGYTIRFKDVGTMTLFITEAKDKGLQVALDECDILKDKLQINFSAEAVKWYESYDDVKAHTTLLELAKDWCDGGRHEHTRQTGDSTYMGESEYKLGFIFVRIGEDTTDVEEDCDGNYDWDWLRVERRVVGDWM